MGTEYLPGIQSSGAKKPHPIAWVVMSVCLVLLAVVIGISIASGDDDDYDVNNSSVAIRHCEDAIKERLKAPATAEFVSAATGSGTWTVSGTVDAENSFGAKLRSTYQCSVVIDSEKETVKVRIDSFE
ncbi:hypothetical protein [Microbacterium sp. Se5.02b]|nr:hypothetical protein [Microbacterium sp. Se5.02b]QYM63489.1 hypothetical protein K1X59_14900 [Microbacterium sp. Se5.02b]